MSTVLVVGGSGLLGFHTTVELVARGHQVTSLSLPMDDVDIEFPEGVTALWQDVNAMTDDELSALLTGMDAVMYAAGADERRRRWRSSRATGRWTSWCCASRTSSASWVSAGRCGSSSSTARAAPVPSRSSAGRRRPSPSVRSPRPRSARWRTGATAPATRSRRP